MPIEVTSKSVKSFAKNLRAVLSDHKLDLKHSQALEILAKTFGFSDWNTLSARLNQPVVNPQISNNNPNLRESDDSVNRSGDNPVQKSSKQLFDTALAGMRFVPIPAGSINLSETYRAEITKDFFMGDHPVTCREFNPYLQDRGKPVRPGQFDHHPVVDVSWFNVHDYITWLNSFDDEFDYRLPTEAEWEYACRAGTTTLYFFGDSFEDLHRYCWSYENSGGELQPVKKLLPNSWGLYDMHGNISEWVRDYFREYPEGSEKDPSGPESGVDRVIRGGSFIYGNYKIMDSDRLPQYLGSAHRDACSPLSCRNFIGFRLVRQPS